jgi:hypothetical protein
MAEIPVVLNDDAARASHDIDNIQSSHRQRECQDDDLDAAGMRTFSMENMTALYNGKQFSRRLKEPVLTPL